MCGSSVATDGMRNIIIKYMTLSCVLSWVVTKQYPGVVENGKTGETKETVESWSHRRKNH